MLHFPFIYAVELYSHNMHLDEICFKLGVQINIKTLCYQRRLGGGSDNLKKFLHSFFFSQGQSQPNQLFFSPTKKFSRVQLFSIPGFFTNFSPAPTTRLFSGLHTACFCYFFLFLFARFTRYAIQPGCSLHKHSLSILLNELGIVK